MAREVAVSLVGKGAMVAAAAMAKVGTAVPMAVKVEMVAAGAMPDPVGRVGRVET